MNRVQLALNVSNLDTAIDFYSTFFRVTPAKVRPGYANFAIENPPLKLVLIEGEGEPGSINHLGIEVFTTADVEEATTYFSSVGLRPTVEEETVCCYATQNKVWIDGPDQSKWEVYTVLSDAPESTRISGDGECCLSASTPQNSEVSVSCC